MQLPFPDVAAISDFVQEQLASEDCRLSDEERRRNAFTPALLLLAADHPLAPRLLGPPPAGPPGSEQAEPAALAEPSSWADQVLADEAESAAEAASAAEQASAGEAAPADEPAPDGASVLSLLLPPGPEGHALAADRPGVLCLPLDLAGQDTPPFSAGLLPGGVACWPACSKASG